MNRTRLAALAIGAGLLVAMLAAVTVTALAWTAGKPTAVCATGEHAGQYLVSVTWTTGGQPPDTGSIYLAPGASGTVRDHHGDHLDVTAPTASCTPTPSPSASPSPSPTPTPSPSGTPMPTPTPSTPPSPTPALPVTGTPAPNPCQTTIPGGQCSGLGKG